MAERRRKKCRSAGGILEGIGSIGNVITSVQAAQAARKLNADALNIPEEYRPKAMLPTEATAESVQAYYLELVEAEAEWYAARKNGETSPEETVHTEKQLSTMEEFNKSTDMDLVSFYERSVAGETLPAYELKPISERQTEAIQEITGIDTTGYSTFIESRIAQHIFKRHGKNGSADHSMSDPMDVGRIQWVLDNFDSAEDGGTSNAYKTPKENGRQGNAKTVLFSKRIDGEIYIVEAIPESKSKRAYIVSAYITKKAGSDVDTQKPAGASIDFTDAQNPGATSETANQVAALADTITQSAETVNSENVSESDTGDKVDPSTASGPPPLSGEAREESSGLVSVSGEARAESGGPVSVSGEARAESGEPIPVSWREKPDLEEIRGRDIDAMTVNGLEYSVTATVNGYTARIADGDRTLWVRRGIANRTMAVDALENAEIVSESDTGNGDAKTSSVSYADTFPGGEGNIEQEDVNHGGEYGIDGDTGEADADTGEQGGGSAELSRGEWAARRAAEAAEGRELKVGGYSLQHEYTPSEEDRECLLAARDLPEATRVVFFTGEARRRGVVMKNVNGTVENGVVYLRADNPDRDIRQTATHERWHLLCEKDPQLGRRGVEALNRVYTPEELDGLVAVYQDIYEIAYGVRDDNGNVINGAEVEQKVLQEICADAFAYIDEHDSRVANASREINRTQAEAYKAWKQRETEAAEAAEKEREAERKAQRARQAAQQRENRAQSRAEAAEEYAQRRVELDADKAALQERIQESAQFSGQERRSAMLAIAEEYSRLEQEEAAVNRLERKSKGLCSLAIDSEDNHIDRRSAYRMGSRDVKAFGYDYPELHPYYAEAAGDMLAALSRSVKGERFYTWTDQEGNTAVDGLMITGQNRQTLPVIAWMLDECGMSYGRIEAACKAIQSDSEQQNNRDAKIVELALDRLLSEGYTDLDGYNVPENEEYIAAKSTIPGAYTAEENGTYEGEEDELPPSVGGDNKPPELIDLGDPDGLYWTGGQLMRSYGMTKKEFSSFYQEIARLTADMEEYGTYEQKPDEHSATFVVPTKKDHFAFYHIEYDGYMHGEVLEKIPINSKNQKMLAELIERFNYDGRALGVSRGNAETRDDAGSDRGNGLVSLGTGKRNGVSGMAGETAEWDQSEGNALKGKGDISENSASGSGRGVSDSDGSDLPLSIGGAPDGMGQAEVTDENGNRFAITRVQWDWLKQDHEPGAEGINVTDANGETRFLEVSQEQGREIKRPLPFGSGKKTNTTTKTAVVFVCHPKGKERAKKPPQKRRTVFGFASFGTPDGIRTHDLWLRRPTLYPAELLARINRYVL